jgi:hypothetical protein
VRGQLAVESERRTSEDQVVTELCSLAEYFGLGLRLRPPVDLLLRFGALGHHRPNSCEEKTGDQSRRQVTPHDMSPFRRRNTPRTAT